MKLFLLCVACLAFSLLNAQNLPKGSFMTTQYDTRNCKGRAIRNITYSGTNCFKAENGKFQKRFCDNKSETIYWNQYKDQNCQNIDLIIFRNKNGDCTEFYNEKYHSCNNVL
jgi:hypothetical protein